MKKILCAPDSFKESLTANQAAQAMRTGIARVDSEIVCDACPIGDGGEGTMDALISALGGRVQTARVIGPLGENVLARFGMVADSNLGVVELAEASGLALVPAAERNPLLTTTYGTGQLIRHCIDAGSKNIIVCLGGSATVDGGTGIAQALGGRFFDSSGVEIEPPMSGEKVARIARLEQPRDLPPMRVACDVANPLCGPNGAAAVYGPQKGATPQMVRQLDESLRHYASVVGGDASTPGAGAAGGAAFGLATICGAKLERGIDLVLDAVNFRARCQDAALVLTGEGRLDAQSLQGKAVMGVARAAHELGVPTIAIVGSTGPGADQCINPGHEGMLRQCISLADRFGLDRAKANAFELVAQIAAEIARASLIH